MKKTVTLVDIANELDIDVSTASKALRDHPKISSATKRKVALVADRLNYQPNKIAAALANGKSNIIGVMIPQTDENFFSSVIRGIEEIAKASGYNIIILQSNDNYLEEVKNLKIMRQAKVDGILASHAMSSTNYSHFQQVIDEDIPLVFFDRFPKTLETDVVAIDDFMAAYKVVTHLIQQECTRIAYLGGDKQVHIYSERFRGYKKALQDHELPIEENIIFESNLKLENGQDITARLLAMDMLPDAIFAASDRAAIGALSELKKHSIQVPEEMAIVGFSNEEFCNFVTPTLTSIDQHSRSMGRSAAKLLLKRLKSEEHSPPPQRTTLHPKLVIRASSSRNED